MSETLGFQHVTTTQNLRDEGEAMRRAGTLISEAERQADLIGAEDKRGFVAGYLAGVAVKFAQGVQCK